MAFFRVSKSWGKAVLGKIFSSVEKRSHLAYNQQKIPWIKIHFSCGISPFPGVNISLKIWNYSPANAKLFLSIVFEIHLFYTFFLKMCFKTYFYVLLTVINCKVKCFHISISYFAPFFTMSVSFKLLKNLKCYLKYCFWKKTILPKCNISHEMQLEL